MITHIKGRSSLLGLTVPFLLFVAAIPLVTVRRARPQANAPEPSRFQRLSEGSTMPSSSQV